MTCYLIVANQTMGGAELIEHVRRVIGEGPCDFHLVVPATPPKDLLTWTEGEAHAIAAQRLEAGLARIRALDAEATGEVGDSSPILGVEDHRSSTGWLVGRWSESSERIDGRYPGLLEVSLVSC